MTRDYCIDWISDDIGLTIKNFDTLRQCEEYCEYQVNVQPADGFYVIYAWKQYLGDAGIYREPVRKYQVGVGTVELRIADIARVQHEDAPRVGRLIAEACLGDPGEDGEAGVRS